MGIVINQSIKNSVTTYIGFVFGAINTLFLYVNFLDDTHYGLVIFLLSTANILSPLLSFGAQHALLKYHSSFTNKVSKDKLISSLLLLPLVAIGIVFAVFTVFRPEIQAWLSHKNPLIASYFWLLFSAAIFMAYFEVFYALARVQYQSVVGNALKEILLRVSVMVLLFLVYLELLTVNQFIYALVIAYFIRTVFMAIYALRISDFSFSFQVPKNYLAILKYTAFIVLTFSVTAIFFDIDKFMIPMYKALKNNAFYSVAVFIAMVIEVPSRAMRQILWPLTAKALNDNDSKQLAFLYKESAINMLIIGGLLYLLILLNIQDFYHLLPSKYSGGFYIVFMISFSKLYEVSLGNNDAILYNSNAYKVLVFFGVFLVLGMILLNNYFIPKYGIEGAALATLITMFSYSTLKWVFVKIKFGMQPYSWNSFYVFVIIKSLLTIFLLIPLHFPVIVNIILRSLVVVLLYISAIFFLKASPTLNAILLKVLRK